MGLDNPIHIAFLLILLLLVFGAKRLPEMGKSLGAGMRGFKDSLTGEDTHTSLTAQQHQPATTALASSTEPAAVAPAATPVAVAVGAPVGESQASPAA
jgi:sec-independent protein translocase protein TatA